MIILPDKNIPRAKFLMPVKKKEWIVPSLAQPKDQFGKENRTYFVIRAHTNDGRICWRGVYEDRDDFDAVIWAIANGTLLYEKELWPLSTPNWHPWYKDLITYSFVTITNYTSPTGSNQTYNKPSDWNDTSNSIECIGAGASGAITQITNNNNTGGGGGAYSKITNFSFTGSSATYQIGTGGVAVAGTIGANSNINGNNGNSTWFNSATDPGNGSDNTKCSAQGGQGGTQVAQNLAVTGSAGGATTSSWGQTKFAGGNSGSVTVAGVNKTGTGGGGAGGSTGAGGNGTDTAASNSGTNGGTGGAGDVGVGSAGTSGTGKTDGTNGGNGGNGTNLSNASVGTGGGGGGVTASVNGALVAGSGGNYGGGGGACRNQGAGNNSSVKATSGAGTGGLIIITYTPQTYLSGQMFTIFN